MWTQKRKYTRGKKKNQILLLFFRLIQKRKKTRHKGLSSVVQRPVHILGKYFNPAEKSMPLCVRPGADTSQQMSESPLSSLNKQLNWADLLIIYRIGSQGATAFVGDTDSICPWQTGFVFHRWSELVGQRNQQLGRSVGWLVGVAVRGEMGVKKKILPAADYGFCSACCWKSKPAETGFYPDVKWSFPSFFFFFF